MKKLSSNMLFYRALTMAILSPFIFTFLINIAAKNNFSDTIRYILYGTLAIFCLSLWYKVLKTRDISYNHENISLKSYFSKISIEIPISSILSIKQVFNPSTQSPRLLYKMKYSFRDKTFKIYFYRSLNLGSYDDLEEFLGVGNKE